MSTKIYTGFLFRSRNLFDIHEHIMAFRKVWHAYVKQETTDATADQVFRTIDNIFYHGVLPSELKDPRSSPFVDANMARIDEAKKTKMHEFSLAVLPYKRKVYGIGFGSYVGFDMWMATGYAVEYRYFNNTDRPEELTARQWRTRMKTWDAILGGNGYGYPSMHGFTAECTLPYIDGFHFDDILARAPEFDQRVHQVALSATYGDLVKDCDQLSAAMELYNNVVSGILDNDPEIMPIYNEHCRKAASLIPRVIDADLLKMDYDALMVRINSSGREQPADA